MSATAVHSVGAGAGFAGDRLEPALELVASGEVDDVVLECLAERTMVDGLRARARGEPGFDPRLRVRLGPLLPLLRERGCRVITNLGAADPVGAAEEVARLARERGIEGMRVAAVTGDDVLARHEQVEWLEPLPEGELLGAHAYLGAGAIAEALAGGADVVVTGRVADSALFLGALREHLDEAPEATAGGLVVGHLLECSGQLSGGNHQGPGGDRLPPEALARLGYPIARVEPSGVAELALLDGASGRLDRFTCTLQLLYEVHDPARYVTPDGVLDLTGVRFEEVARNRVRVSGATLAGVPERLKVSGFVERPGVLVDAEIGYAGRDALERAREAAEVLRLRLATRGIEDPVIDFVGVDSLLGPASGELRSPPPELRVHVIAESHEEELARGVEDEIFALTLAGPPHGGGIRVERRPRVAVVEGRIDRLPGGEVVWAS